MKHYLETILVNLDSINKFPTSDSDTVKNALCLIILHQNSKCSDKDVLDCTKHIDGLADAMCDYKRTFDIGNEYDTMIELCYVLEDIISNIKSFDSMRAETIECSLSLIYKNLLLSPNSDTIL